MYRNSPKQSKYPEGMDDKGKPYRVLIVDDEEIPRRLISQIVASAGYDICGEATNGIEAIEMYNLHKPDVVTMDVQMPQMNGTVAIKKIKQIDPEAVVVMMTSVVEKDTVLEILKSGAKGYIVKPVQRKLVLEKLREVRAPAAGRRSAQSDPPG